MIENVKYFWNNYDFDMLVHWLTNVDPVALLLNPVVFIPLVIIFGLMANQKTAYIGQMLVTYGPSIGFLFVTATVVRNGAITESGPFAMAMTSFFMVVIWFIWTKLLQS